MHDPARRRIRRHHQAALFLLVAVIAGYALWLRGDRSASTVQNRAPAPSPESMAVTSPAPSAPAVVASEPPTPAASIPTEPYDIAHALVQEQLELPQDDGDLAAMLRAGTLVELAPLGEDYILYDIGTDAADDPMAAYDPDTHKDVPLFASAADLDAERASLAELAQESPSRRTRVQAEARLSKLATSYDDPARRDVLLKKGADIAALAANFTGQSYDLEDPVDRGRFDARMLSLIRPGARDVILDVAREYHQRFGRLLPVTSLVRTERYQRRLTRVNAN